MGAGAPRDPEVLVASVGEHDCRCPRKYLYNDLENRVRERNSQLQQANDERQAFFYSASHDLRASEHRWILRVAPRRLFGPAR